MRARQAERVTQEIGQQQARLDGLLIGNAINSDGNVAQLAHVMLSCARRQAAASDLPASTPTKWRR